MQNAVLALLFPFEVFRIFVRALVASNKDNSGPGGRPSLYCLVCLVSGGLLEVMAFNISIREIVASS